jgi:hypothetical protein
MYKSIKRTLKSRQVGLVKTYHLISGTATTPADSGLDQAFISSIDDLATGIYKINVIEPSRLNLVVDGLAPVTTKTILEVSAVDKSSVTIKAWSDAGVAKDADFYIGLVHSTLLDTLF